MHAASKINYRWLIPILLLPGCLTMFSACSGNKTGNIFKEDYLNVDAFQNSLYQRLKPVDTNDPQFEERLMADMDLNVIYAYQLSTYRPFWFDRSGLLPAGEMLPKALQSLRYDGLDPDDYDLTRIQRIVRTASNSKVGILDSVQQWDAEMTKAYLTAARDLLVGIPGLAPDSLWHIPNDQKYNGAVIFSRIMDTSNHFPGFDAFRPPLVSYYKMRNAVKKWQELNQDSIYLENKKRLKTDQDSLIARIINKELGIPTRTFNPDSLAALRARYQKLHQLKVTATANAATFQSLKQLPEYYIQRLFRNMERLRELPRDMGDTYLWLNITAGNIRLIRNDSIVFSGRVESATNHKQSIPAIASAISAIVVHPGLPVPRQQVAAGIREKGASYLVTKNIHAYNRQGKDVTSSVNPETDLDLLLFRQANAPASPFGRLLFIMPNSKNIILCDTLADGVNPAKLNGRIWLRVSNADQLAERLLKHSGGKTTALRNSRRHQTIPLNPPVSVYIVHLDVVAEPPFGQLIYLHDDQ